VKNKKMELEYQPVLFSEFVASFFLLKNEIDYLELTKMTTKFSYDNPDYEIIEPDDDFSLLSHFLVFEDNNISINKKYNYDSLITYNNETKTLYDILKDNSSKIVVDYLENHLDINKQDFLNKSNETFLKIRKK